MSQIKSKNTKPEMLVRKFLHYHGYRCSLHDKKIPSKPDIVLKKHSSIIDVRGCFWHLHTGCKYGDQVSTPSEKITIRRKTALDRDNCKMKKWKDAGWNVYVVWAECELEPRKKQSQKRGQTLNNLLNKFKV